LTNALRQECFLLCFLQIHFFLGSWSFGCTILVAIAFLPTHPKNWTKILESHCLPRLCVLSYDMENVPMRKPINKEQLPLVYFPFWISTTSSGCSLTSTQAKLY
jgi:hypothetical protein